MMSDDYATAKALSGMRTDITELQKQTARQEVLVERFDDALDKISEVSLNVSKLLAVHEQRLEAQEEHARKIPELIEKRHEEYVGRFELAHSRMTTLDEGLRKDMADGQKEILGEIKELRKDMTKLGTELSEKTDELKADLTEDLDSRIEEVKGRVTKLEKQSWLVIGGATVVGFLISMALGLAQFFTGG